MKIIIQGIVISLSIVLASTQTFKNETQVFPDARELQPSNIGSFTSIAAGYYSNIEVAVADVFRDETCFCQFWAAHDDFSSDCPTVDFETSMVIALFRGTQNTGGYDIRVTSVVEDMELNQTIVKAISTDPAPYEMTTQVLTQPFHIVSTETSPMDVVFEVDKVRSSRPFPSFLVIIEDGYELTDIRDEIDGLSAVLKVITLERLGMLIVHFDEDKITAQNANDLLNGIEGIIVEADPPIMNEGDYNDEKAATEDPTFNKDNEWSCKDNN